MNNLTADLVSVKPEAIDTAADDAAWSVWLEANADELAAESEALDFAENYLRF